MKKISFKTNRKIELKLPDNDTAISLIQEVNEKYFLITIPLKGKNRILLAPGTKLDAIYYFGSSAYGFKTTILGRTKDKIPMYKITPPRDIYKFERRQFVRIDLSNDILYSQNSSVLEGDVERLYDVINSNRVASYFKTGYCVNLSGGGLRFIGEDSLTPEEILMIHLQDNNLDVITKCRVIRSDKINSNRGIMYETALEFEDISERNRERIISYIFENMRKRRKNSLSEKR